MPSPSRAEVSPDSHRLASPRLTFTANSSTLPCQRFASLMNSSKPRVALFITCLGDQFFPRVGECAVNVLRRLGVEVTFNPAQTCCGQPAFNTGFRQEAREVAARVLDLYRDAEYVVSPSGSCTSMVRVFYPELFADDSARLQQALDLKKRFFEFSEFLVKVLKV